MFKALVAILLILGFLTLGLHSRRSQRAASVQQPRPPATAPAKKETGNEKVVFSASVISKRSGSLQEARNGALKEGQLQIQAHLLSQNPPVDWVPSLDDIQGRLIKGPEKVIIDPTEVVPGEEPQPVYQVSFDVEISADEYGNLLGKGREARMETRMMGLGKLLAGLVLVFAGFAGFLRLDEKTKGFYTGWLKVAAVGLAVAAGAWLLYWARSM